MSFLSFVKAIAVQSIYFENFAQHISKTSTIQARSTRHSQQCISEYIRYINILRQAGETPTLLNGDIDQGAYAQALYDFKIEQVQQQLEYAAKCILTGDWENVDAILCNAGKEMKNIQINQKNINLLVDVFRGRITAAIITQNIYRAINLCHDILVYSQINQLQAAIDIIVGREKLKINWEMKQVVYNGSVIFSDYYILKCIARSDRHELLNKYDAKKCGWCSIVFLNKKSTAINKYCEQQIKSNKNKKCSKCKITFYCSKSHQKRDWKVKHKAICL